MQLFPSSDLDQPHGAAGTQPESGFGAFRCRAGLFPMRALALETAVTGLHYRSTLKQRFINAYNEVLEATYIFPLPGRSAVTACTMKVGDRTVEAKLAERAEARQRYEKAIDSGHRAALGEEERPEVFSMTLGNLAPGDIVTVELELAGELSWDAGVATYRFPLVVAPRYIPGVPLPMEQSGDGQALDTDLVPDASRITPPVLLPGFPNPVQLSVDVTVDDGGLAFESAHCNLPCSAIDSDRGGDGGGPLHLRLEPGQRLDRDLLVRIPVDLARDSLRASALFQPDGERETDSNGHAGTLAVTVIPSTATGSSAPRDVAFLLDCSSSMGGWKIVAARSAAARLVESLDARDRFCVFTFASTSAEPPMLGRELAPATDRNRYEVSRWLSSVEAHGGTNIIPAFEAAADRLAEAGGDAARQCAIVIVTDGHVGNEDHFLRRLGQSERSAQVFTVGVDMAVNAGLLERLATATGGSCTLVQSEAALNEGIEAVRGRIGRPAFTGAQLGADGVQFDAPTPQRHSDAYPGKPWTVLARCSEPLGSNGPGSSVHLQATGSDGQPLQLAIPVTRSDHAPLGAIWARWRIRDLEDDYASGTGDRQAIESEILHVSLSHRVLSRFTAWLAVDETETVTGADATTRRKVVQAVESPAGWDMMNHRVAMMAALSEPRIRSRRNPDNWDMPRYFQRPERDSYDLGIVPQADMQCPVSKPRVDCDPATMAAALAEIASLVDELEGDDLIHFVRQRVTVVGALRKCLVTLEAKGLVNEELRNQYSELKKSARRGDATGTRTLIIEVVAGLLAVIRKLQAAGDAATP